MFWVTPVLVVVFLFTSCFNAVTCSAPNDDEEPLPYEVALNITGGRSQLDQEIGKIREYASTLRNDTPNYADHLSEGLHGFVLRLRFDDNTTWAAKIAQNLTWQNNDMRDAIRSLKSLERYCPHVPVPRVYGELGSLANGSLIYFLTDWINGTTLEDDPECFGTPLNETVDGKILVSYTLPEMLVPQLAEFVYNVTTCPIPGNERCLV
jgi:hypothetical protein